ncbi:MAG TPA: hypothetical protein VMU07_01085 [Candidatus Paceibacterota bacterium]|nr:hypothetical protein [Candidatus Paceibacterota bacterium]
MKQNTKRLYSLIFSLLFVTAAFVVYFDLIIPAYTDLQTSKGNLLGEQALLANEQKVSTQIKNLVTTYQGQESQVQLVNEALPVGPHLADAISQIYGLAQASNMSIQTVQIEEQMVPSTALGGGGSFANAASTGQVVKPVGTIAFTFTVTGSYENFKNFMAGLEDNMRFFDVSGLSLQPVQQASGKASLDSYLFSLTATTYFQSQ